MCWVGCVAVYWVRVSGYGDCCFVALGVKCDEWCEV